MPTAILRRTKESVAKLIDTVASMRCISLTAAAYMLKATDTQARYWMLMAEAINAIKVFRLGKSNQENAKVVIMCRPDVEWPDSAYLRAGDRIVKIDVHTVKTAVCLAAHEAKGGIISIMAKRALQRLLYRHVTPAMSLYFYALLERVFGDAIVETRVKNVGNREIAVYRLDRNKALELCNRG
jgi:hypothetical protein